MDRPLYNPHRQFIKKKKIVHDYLFLRSSYKNTFGPMGEVTDLVPSGDICPLTKEESKGATMTMEDRTKVGGFSIVLQHAY